VSQTNVVPPRAPEGARFRPRPKPLTKPRSVTTTPIATAAFAQIRNCHHGHADGLCLSRHHVLNTWTIAGSRHLLLFCLLFPKRVKTKHGQQPRLPQSRPQRSYFAPFPIRRVTRRNRKISLTNAQSQKKNCPIPLFLFPSAIQARCGTPSLPLLRERGFSPPLPQPPLQGLPSPSTKHGCPPAGDDPKLPTGRSLALNPDQHGEMGTKIDATGRHPASHTIPFFVIFFFLFFLFLL
jgi:hypothetical protein